MAIFQFTFNNENKDNLILKLKQQENETDRLLYVEVLSALENPIPEEIEGNDNYSLHSLWVDCVESVEGPQDLSYGGTWNLAQLENLLNNLLTK